MASPVPRFDHDCDRCVFLGDINGQDAYVCPQGGYPTIVLRLSDVPWEYSSGGHLIDRLPRPMAARANRLMESWR